MRSPTARLDWYLSHRPVGANRCAEYLMQSLDVPAQGFPDATAVATKVIRDGHMITSGPVPLGAIRYWTGGGNGHGHVALEATALSSPSMVASVDVEGPGTVGIKTFGWFEKNWPNLRYAGWSWWWGGINTEEVPVADWVEGQHKIVEGKKVEVAAGIYTTVGAITIGKGGSYWLTLQTRLPAGRYARIQFTRVGWGKDPDGRDETGPDPLVPPDGLATSFTRNHRIEGGGPVAFEIKVSGKRGEKVVLPYVICKAERIT